MKLAVALILFASSLSAAETVFEFDPSKTEIKFSLHGSMHTVHGTIQLKRGTVRLDPESGKASGDIVIDVTSAQTGNGSRDNRMHKEILESQKYPEAMFTPDRVEGRIASQGESEIDVHGVFKIHGGEHELTPHFVVQADGQQLTATTLFTIPYVRWGIKNPSNFFLRVDDKVEMEVRARAFTRV